MKTLVKSPFSTVFATRTLIMAFLSASALTARSQTSGTWINSASNSTWGTASNWSGNSIATGVDAAADFSALDIAANRTVNLGASWTVGSLLFADATTASNNWTLANGTGGPWLLTLATSAGTPTIQLTNQTTTISAALAGTQGFAKTGSGTLTLTGTNTFTGGVTLAAGVLNFGVNALGTNLVTFTGNSTLGWNGTNAADLSAQIKIEDGVTATLATGANNVTLASALQTGSAATASVTKTGGGTLTFTAANTYTGTTRVNAGRIALTGGDDRLAPASSILLGAGSASGIVQLGDASDGSSQTVKSIATAGSGMANAIVGGNAAVSTLTVNNSAAVSYGGLLGGGGTNENNLALAKSGAGALTLSGAGNSFVGGVTVNGGALIIKNSNALGSGPKTATIVGATNAPSLQLDGGTADITLASGLSLVTSNQNANTPAIVNTAGNNIINGAISPTNGGSGAGGTRIKVNGGTLTLNGGISPAASATSNRTLILDGAGDGTINGSISNNGPIALAVTKDGAGTWTLTAGNSFSGAFTVIDGTLQVDNTGGSGTGTGAVTVQSGAKLQGTGRIGGITNVQSGAFLEAATSTATGTLTFASRLNLLDGSTTDFHLDGASSYDRIITQNFAAGSGASSSALFRIFLDAGYTPVAGDSFDLIDWTTLLPGDTDLADNLDLSSALLDSGLTWDTSTFHSSGVIRISAIVPEPSRALLMMLGLIVAGLGRRRTAPAGLPPQSRPSATPRVTFAP